jgi:hypothetical protein
MKLKVIGDTAVLTEGLDRYTGVDVKYTQAVNRPDGVAITDADLGGIYIKDNTTDLYYQRNFEGPINVLWFGAKDDVNTTTGAGTDNTAAIQNAINAAKLFNRSVYVPAAKNPNKIGGYRITGTIFIPDAVDFDGQGIIYLDTAATDNSPAIQVGTETATAYRGIYNFKVSKPTTKFSNWSTPDGDGAGVRLLNCFASDITILLARGFNTAILVDAVVTGANDNGCAYNKFYLFNLWNNRHGVWCRSKRVSGTGVPFVNQNEFYGGNFASPSGGSGQSGKSRYGVRVTSTDGTGSHNANTWHEPSFELNTASASPNEALPVLLEGGIIYHFFQGCRAEANTGPNFARLTGTISRYAGNTFEVTYTENMTGIDDQTGGTGNYFRLKSDLPSTYMDNVVHVTDLSKKLKGYNNTTRIAPGYSFINPATSAIPSATSPNATLGIAGGISLSANSMMGVVLDITSVKTYCISKSIITGARLNVICYDADYNLVGTGSVFPFKSSIALGFSTVGTLTARYATQADSNNNIIITFDSTASKAFIGITGIAKGFEIKALEHSNDPIVLNPGSNQSTSTLLPIFGYYKPGELSLNASNTTNTLGWQCTAGGFASNISWAATTAYTTGNIVNVGGLVYLCTVAGTTSSTSPTHTSGSATDGTVTWLYIDALASFIAITTNGISSLNGLTGPVQTFATGTAGTDFNIGSSGTTHTFNIPDASSANRGLVTTGTQTLQGDKTINGLLTVLKAAATQLIAGYDISNYLSIALTSTGSATITVIGSNPSRTITIPIATLLTGGITAGSTSNNLFIGFVSSAFITTVPQYLFGGAPSIQGRVGIRGVTSAALSLNNSYGSLIIGANDITTAPSGSHPVIANLVVKIPTITPGGAAIPIAASAWIEGAPTGATFNAAIYAAAGISYLKGGLRFDQGSDATGDIYYRDASGNFVRLPIGTNGQVLNVVSGLPAWAANQQNVIPLKDFYTDQGNTSTTPGASNALYSFSVAANQLNADGQKIKAKYAGVFAANANNKSLSVFFATNNIGGNTVSTSADGWEVTVLIIRTSATTARVTVTVPGINPIETPLTGLDFTTTNTLVLNGAGGGAANDVVAKLGTIEWVAAAP